MQSDSCFEAPRAMLLSPAGQSASANQPAKLTGAQKCKLYSQSKEKCKSRMQPVMMQPCDEKVINMLDAKATIAFKLVGTHRFEIQVWLVEIDLKFNLVLLK